MSTEDHSAAVYRSSHQRCSMKKDVLRNFTKFTGKHLCQSLFFNRVADLRPVMNLAYRGVNFSHRKFSRAPFH